jgi:hypothetical protein
MTPPLIFKVFVSIVLLLPSLACRSLGDAEAEKLVRTYNAKLIEAFRTGDEQLMEGLTGDAEAKKLLGLIGVKSDMGINLDSALTSFKVLRVEHPSKRAVDVITEENWHYQNREIGSGRIVGQPSDDHYVMRYALAIQGKAWVVASVAFEKPPVVGRDSAPNQAPAQIFHGMAPLNPVTQAPMENQKRTP